jgi:hypothetical protein
MTFGLVESWLFVEGRPDANEGYALYRFTAPVVMHTFASFILGSKLTPSSLPALVRRRPLPPGLKQAYLTAVGLHLGFNIMVVTLGAVGLGDFAGDASR